MTIKSLKKYIRNIEMIIFFFFQKSTKSFKDKNRLQNLAYDALDGVLWF